MCMFRFEFHDIIFIQDFIRERVCDFDFLDVRDVRTR